MSIKCRQIQTKLVQNYDFVTSAVLNPYTCTYYQNNNK